MTTTLDPTLAAARNPQSPQALLRELASRPVPKLQEAVASNPNTPIDLLVQLARSHPAAFLANPALSLLEIADPGSLHALSAEDALALIEHPGVPVWLLRLFLAIPGLPPYQRAALARAETTTPEVLLALASSEGGLVRCEAARNPAMPEEGMALLLADSSPEVRATIARTSHDPERLALLARDPHPFPRLLARSRLEVLPASTPAVRAWPGGGHTDVGGRNHNEDEFLLHPLRAAAWPSWPMAWGATPPATLPRKSP